MALVEQPDARGSAPSRTSLMDVALFSDFVIGTKLELPGVTLVELLGLVGTGRLQAVSRDNVAMTHKINDLEPS